MKNKLKVLLPLLFVISLLVAIPLTVNAEECEHENFMNWGEIEPACHYSGNDEYFECLDCGLIWTDKTHVGIFDPYIPPLGGEVEHVTAKEPTCSELGNIEYWYCENCDQYWTDEALTRLTNRLSVRIGTLEHTTVYVESKEPTCTEDGNIEYWYCEECGLKIPGYDAYIPEIEYDIPALGHDYVNDICQRCGDVKETTAVAYGLEITVYKLDGVRDFLIAPGHHEVYSGIKQSYILRVTEAKFSGKESYTAFVTAPGEYTVLVRYNDGSEQTYHYVTAEAVTPEFSVSGLSVSISNLEGLRTIRTAPGEWNTPGEVKRAAGARNIPARNISGDTYKLQYAEDGVYTVSLEYTNGLVVVEQFELSRTEPTLVQDGNVVTLGNLDDLYVVRYAPGEFTSSYDIKRAEGAKYVRPYGVDENGEIVIELDDKVYTICVQYNDGSCNFFTVNKEEPDVLASDADVSLLEKYGLTYDVQIWRNEMPSTTPMRATNLAVQFKNADEAELPDMKVSVKIGWCDDIVLFEQSDRKGFYRLPTERQINDLRWDLIVEDRDTTELDDMEWDLMLLDDMLESQKGESVRIEITVTIDGISEVIVVNSVYGVVC